MERGNGGGNGNGNGHAGGNGFGADGGEFQSPALERLVRSLSRLPGLGRKSATRVALHLLTGGGAAAHAEELTETLAEARRQVRTCSSCGAITEPSIRPCSLTESAAAAPSAARTLPLMRPSMCRPPANSISPCTLALRPIRTLAAPRLCRSARCRP